MRLIFLMLLLGLTMEFLLPYSPGSGLSCTHDLSNPCARHAQPGPVKLGKEFTPMYEHGPRGSPPWHCHPDPVLELREVQALEKEPSGRIKAFGMTD